MGHLSIKRNAASAVSTFGFNSGYVEDLYAQYLENPESVSERWREFFADYQPGPTFHPHVATETAPGMAVAAGPVTQERLDGTPEPAPVKTGGDGAPSPTAPSPEARRPEPPAEPAQPAEPPRASWRTWRPASKSRRPPPRGRSRSSSWPRTAASSTTPSALSAARRSPSPTSSPTRSSRRSRTSRR